MVKIQVVVKSINTVNSFGICLVAKCMDTMPSYDVITRCDTSSDVITDVESDFMDSVSTCGGFSDSGSDSDSGHGRDGKLDRGLLHGFLYIYVFRTKKICHFSNVLRIQWSVYGCKYWESQGKLLQHSFMI